MHCRKVTQDNQETERLEIRSVTGLCVGSEEQTEKQQTCKQEIVKFW